MFLETQILRKRWILKILMLKVVHDDVHGDPDGDGYGDVHGDPDGDGAHGCGD